MMRMRRRFVHVRRHSTAMADMTHDLATLNSNNFVVYELRCLWSET